MIDRESPPDLFAATPQDTLAQQKPEHRPAHSTDTSAPIGLRLRTAREAQKRTVADCAQQLHLPIKVLQRLETGDLGPSEHFVFMRGALRSYARLLGLPPGSCDEALRAAAPAEQPALVAVARTSPARWLLQRYGTAATYIALTALIAVPLVLLGLRGGLRQPVTQIVSLDQAPTATGTHTGAVKSAAGTLAQPSPDESPFRASMTPFVAIGLNDIDGTGASSTHAPAVTVPAGGVHTLTLTASADCWYEIADANGNRIASGLLHAGDSRTWHPDAALSVTLGNANAVEVTGDGKPVALDTTGQASVAHFEVFAQAAGGSGAG
jgi:cytoskeleton protein RodZ